MEDERAKYLIVNANDITKQLYKFERIAYCNDFDNIYHRVKKINADEIFAKNNVPERFRIIIIKISKQFFSKSEAEEYIMGFPFNFAARVIEKVNKKKYIRMHNSPIYHDGSTFNDKIVLKTEEQYTSFNNVMYFLEKIYKEGCLENYLQSIKELFDISLDLDLFFAAWDQTHNKRKALRLYKREVASKTI